MIDDRRLRSFSFYKQLFVRKEANPMAWAAPAQYQTNSPSEINGAKISQEEMDKLQEIHELINLLFTELTAMPPQGMAPSYLSSGLSSGLSSNLPPGLPPGLPTGLPPGLTTGMPSTMASAPYTHSLFHYFWGMSPYFRVPGY
jgi:hypothetical protein